MNLVKSWRSAIPVALIIIASFGLPTAGQSQRPGSEIAPATRQPTLMVQAGPAIWVWAVAFSPDGRYVLSGGYEKVARLWDVETQREIRRFEGHDSYVFAVAFSPDGTSVLTGSRDGTARLWNVETGEELRRFDADSDAVKSVAFSPDGKLVLGGCLDGLVRLWDAGTGKEVRRFRVGTDGAPSVAFSPDGKYVLSDAGNVGLLWETETGKEVRRFEGHSASIWSVAFSPDGKYALTGSDDKTARLWDVETGKEVRRFEGHTANVVAVAFSPTGKYVLTGSQDATARLWDVQTGKEIRRFEGHHHPGVWSVAFSPSGRYAVTGGFDKTVRVWKVETGEELRRFDGQAHIVLSTEFSTDGRYMLSGGLGNGVSLWEIRTGREVRRFAARNSWSSAISPNGRYVITGSEDKFAQIWSVETGEELHKLEGHSDDVRRVAFSPDSKYALTGSNDKTARLWDVETGKEVRRFEGHSDQINSVAFSPNGKFVLTGSSDKVARLWETDTGRELRRFEGHTGGIGAATFSPNGMYVLTGSDDRTVRLWEADTGKEIRRFEKYLDHVWAVAFSPDGKYVLTGDDGETAILWDAATGNIVRSFKGHSGIVQAVAFSPDGRYVLTGGIDSTARLWELSTGKEFCKLISFTDGNWVVVAQDGRFDASSLDSLEGLNWVVPDDPMRPLPIEIFMRDYYEPRLLPRLLDDIPDADQFTRVRSLTSLNRVQPHVEIIDVRLAEGSTDTALVTVEASGAVAERKRGSKELDETGVFDLRLFRDGQLVGYWPSPNVQLQQVSFEGAAGQARDEMQLQMWRRDAEIQLDGGKFRKTFTVKLPHRQDMKQVSFTAYAFNRDRVRSAVARMPLSLPGPQPVRKGKAYIITVGVNLYEVDAPGYTLKNAVRDAESGSQQLYESLKKTEDFEDVVRIKLVSDERVKTAIKQNLKAVFDVLAGKMKVDELKRLIPNAEKLLPDIDKLGQATPDDLVIISFASHGENYEGNFFILPYDTGRLWDRREILKHSISSEELSLWLMGVDAGDLLMIIDACKSGAATGEGFKAGPMDSRGLGQLAYDKGMKVLAATQADSNAAEVEVVIDGTVIRGGLLSYVLIEEALKRKRAAANNLITGRSWMEYAVAEVPKIYDQLQKLIRENGHPVPLKRSATWRLTLKGEERRKVTVIFRAMENEQAGATQHPMMFDFTKKQQEVVLARF